jgi:hypothetical protein
MANIDKAKAMQCFGRLVEKIEEDPDPKAQDKLTSRLDCKDCSNHEYCCKLADTLKE